MITDNASVSFPHIPSIVIIADFILHCPFRFISRTVKSAEFLNIFFRVEIFLLMNYTFNHRLNISAFILRYIGSNYANISNGDVMLISIIRTILLYAFVILAVRLMGKRQMSDMQPSELVITMIVSDIASIPMQNTSQTAVERSYSRCNSRCT